MHSPVKEDRKHARIVRISGELKGILQGTQEILKKKGYVMVALKSLQKTESHNDQHLTGRKNPLKKSTRLLKFTSGSRHYAVDMSELKQVIRDLIAIQNSTSKSVTARFIKRNREQTIIFNLDSCFNIQQRIIKNDKKTSILILNETIAGSHVGVLVPGTPAILKWNNPLPETGAGFTRRNDHPVRGIGKKKPGTVKKVHGITRIDIRELVENCIVRLNCLEAEGMAAQTA